MYISPTLNLLLVGTAALIASSPSVQCEAANLRTSSAKPNTDELYDEKSWWTSAPTPNPTPYPTPYPTKYPTPAPSNEVSNFFICLELDRSSLLYSLTHTHI